MELKMDSRWEVWDFDHTFPTFKSTMLPKLFLKEEVADDIKKAFNVVTKLLDHSYYEYEFYDVAAREALFTFEMALKIRYKEVNGGEEWPDRNPLVRLIDWFESRGYFEVYNEYFMQHLRHIRNSFAHRKHYGFGGPMMRQWILHPMDLINDLYEDVPLRQRRKEQLKKYEARLEEICENGALMKMRNKVSTVFLARVGFINNKKKPKEIALFFASQFLIPENVDTGDAKHQIVPVPFLQVTCNSVSFTEKSMTIKDTDGGAFATLTKLEGSAAEKFTEWKQKFLAYEKETHHNFLLHSEISSFYDNERRAFHQQ